MKIELVVLIEFEKFTRVIAQIIARIEKTKQNKTFLRISLINQKEKLFKFTFEKNVLNSRRDQVFGG